MFADHGRAQAIAYIAASPTLHLFAPGSLLGWGSVSLQNAAPGRALEAAARSWLAVAGPCPSRTNDVSTMTVDNIEDFKALEPFFR